MWSLIIVTFSIVLQVGFAINIRAGQCLDKEPYTVKLSSTVEHCYLDCSGNIYCKAAVFDRLTRVCSYFEGEISIRECPGKYLTLKSDDVEVLSINHIFLYLFVKLDVEMCFW